LNGSEKKATIPQPPTCKFTQYASRKCIQREGGGEKTVRNYKLDQASTHYQSSNERHRCVPIWQLCEAGSFAAHTPAYVHAGEAMLFL
jgi:hypothetical protein